MSTYQSYGKLFNKQLFAAFLPLIFVADCGSGGGGIWRTGTDTAGSTSASIA